MSDPTLETPSKRHAILLGWTCLIVGLYVMFSSLWLFFVYGPLYLATLACTIVALSRRRVLAGVTLLVVLLVIPPVCWLFLTVYRGASAVDHGVTVVQEHVARDIEEDRQKRLRLNELLRKIEPDFGTWTVTLWDRDGKPTGYTGAGGFVHGDGQGVTFVVPLDGQPGSYRVFTAAEGGNRGGWHDEPAGTTSGWFEIDAKTDVKSMREISFRWDEGGEQGSPKRGSFTRN